MRVFPSQSSVLSPRHLAPIALLGCMLAIGVCAVVARADDAPAATQPQTIAPAPPQDPVVFLQHLQRRLDNLNLTDDQKDRVKAAMETDQQQATVLQSQLQDARPAVRMQRMAAFTRQVREQLVEILTPQQLLALRPAPASQPAAGNESATPFLQRLHEAIDQLDLTDAQKAQVDDLFKTGEAKVVEIRKDPTLRGDAREVITNLRVQVLQALTPDQRQKLRELMNNAPPDAVPQPGTARTANANQPSMVMTPDNASGQKPAESHKQLSTDAPTLTSAVAGSAAPPFHLLTTGSAEIKSDSFAHRVVVMEFGSLSCPTFRDHVAEMKLLQSKYGDRVYFLLVYTREQHPAGGWESARNDKDGISIPQPPDLPARQAQANQARMALHLTMPIGVDDMDDAITKAYNGFPNATIVIGRDGKITGRQQWTDPSGLPRLIDAAVAGK
jgi:Spy/CpxP family protein refolding chaperone